MPPKSQTDRPNPQEHSAIHARDSASIFFAQRRGKMPTNNRWIDDI